jgi:hypothetical protein
MDSGRPVLLLLLRDIGPFADPTAARFVLATRYDADPTRAMVWTYDPRRPGDDAATLTLDPGKGSEPFVGRMGREETVRGVIAVPYDRAAPPAIVASSSPKDERRRVGLEEDLAEFDAGPNALGLLARDTEAHLVCIRHDDGGWSRERPADLGDVGADFRFEGAPYPAGGSGDRPSAVVRGVNGHLLHLRRGSRDWIAEDLTDQPNTGLRFRLEGDPVVLAEGRHPVVAGVNGDAFIREVAFLDGHDQRRGVGQRDEAKGCAGGFGAGRLRKGATGESTLHRAEQGRRRRGLEQGSPADAGNAVAFHLVSPATPGRRVPCRGRLADAVIVRFSFGSRADHKRKRLRGRRPAHRQARPAERRCSACPSSGRTRGPLDFETGVA